MIVLKDPRPIQKAVKAISTFISEGNFRFNDNGMTFKAIDQSQIVLVNFGMKKELFDKFTIESNLVGLDLDEFNKIMKRAFPEDKLTITLDDSHMHIELDGAIERKFSLSMLDVPDDETKIPEQDFDATIKIKARILQEALKDASLFGSSVVLSVKEGKLSIEAQGSHGTLFSKSKNTKAIIVKSKKDVTSKFSLNFLQGIIAEAEPDSNIVLEMQHEAPLKISYPIGKTNIDFHLAHMIL